MKARLLVTLEAAPSADPAIVVIENGRRFVLAGTVIDHPDAWKLVFGGFAAAEDDECKARVEKTPAEARGLQREVHDRIIAEQAEFVEEYIAEQEAENAES
jgi:hypothetical protein